MIPILRTLSSIFLRPGGVSGSFQKWGKTDTATRAVVLQLDGEERNWVRLKKPHPTHLPGGQGARAENNTVSYRRMRTRPDRLNEGRVKTRNYQRNKNRLRVIHLLLRAVILEVARQPSTAQCPPATSGRTPLPTLAYRRSISPCGPVA